MGKTTLAINIATNAESGTPVGVFSLEMTDEELAHRIVCSKSSVNGRSVMAGELTKSEWGRNYSYGVNQRPADLLRNQRGHHRWWSCGAKLGR